VPGSVPHVGQGDRGGLDEFHVITVLSVLLGSALRGGSVMGTSPINVPTCIIKLFRLDPFRSHG